MSQTTEILSYGANDSEAATTTLESSSSRQTTFLEMPAPGTQTSSLENSPSAADRNSLMKRLSYLQKFSALIAKNDS